MLKKALHLLANLSLGKDMALALKILHLLAPLVEKVNSLSGLDVARLVSRQVYAQLPAPWKFPDGPATEDEFLDAIQAGQIFLGKVKALTTH